MRGRGFIRVLCVCMCVCARARECVCIMYVYAYNIVCIMYQCGRRLLRVLLVISKSRSRGRAGIKAHRGEPLNEKADRRGSSNASDRGRDTRLTLNPEH
jgi:hypothetical protein